MPSRPRYDYEPAPNLCINYDGHINSVPPDIRGRAPSSDSAIGQFRAMASVIVPLADLGDDDLALPRRLDLELLDSDGDRLLLGVDLVADEP
jgi:hypothetical protein